MVYQLLNIIYLIRPYLYILLDVLCHVFLHYILFYILIIYCFFYSILIVLNICKHYYSKNLIALFNKRRSIIIFFIPLLLQRKNITNVIYRIIIESFYNVFSTIAVFLLNTNYSTNFKFCLIIQHFCNIVNRALIWTIEIDALNTFITVFYLLFDVLIF